MRAASTRLGAVGLVLAAAALFGTTGTAQALGPSSATPLGVGAARLVVGGLALLAVLPVVGTPRAGALALWRTPAGIVAGACTCLYQVAFFAGVQRAGVALGTLVAIGSGPVLTGVLARWRLGERGGRAWLLATGLCLTGLSLLVLGGTPASRPDPLGVLLAVVAGSAYAVYTVVARQQMVAGHAPAAVVGAAFGLGGLLSIPILVSQPLGWLTEADGLALALYLGLVATTVAYLLFGRGLAALAAGPVTTLMLAEPLVATTLGVVVLDEQLSILGGVGAALVLVGLLVVGSAAQGRDARPA
ncbi:MAG TPA: EamA family transporter [Acidimicrobiales bacterium]|nr:EamA family transporter [Acidimicrobiales bacterium]